MDKIVTKDALKKVLSSLNDNVEYMTVLDATNAYLEISNAVENEYFGIIALEQSFRFTIEINEDNPNEYQIRKNGNEWKTIYSNSMFIDNDVVPGDIYEIQYIYGEYPINGVANSYRRINCNTKYSVFGNIKSLRGYGYPISSQYRELFRQQDKLISAKYLKLEDETTTNYMYDSMFSACVNLEECPELPKVETINEHCYSNMFFSCRKLKKAPDIIYAERVMSNGCANMFNSCSLIEKTPILSAKYLYDSAYGAMFRSCDNLKTVSKIDAIEFRGNYVFSSMFQYCKSLINPPELPITELKAFCYRLMFNDCISLEKAPVLPATTLKNGCYDSMFLGCTKLNYIECLAESIDSANTYFTYRWTEGVSDSGKFVKNEANTEWGRGDNGIPYNWDIQNYIKISIYIDDFPDGIWEDDGYDNFDDYFDNYYSVDYDESGANKLTSTGETLEYEGTTYYVWRGDNDNCPGALVLTNTVSYDELYPESIEADHSNRVCPIYAWFNSDDDDPYIANYDDDSYVLVAVRR